MAMHKAHTKSGKTSFTFDELTSYLAQTPMTNTNVNIVADNSDVSFGVCNKTSVPNALSQRLLIGTQTAVSSESQYVWAHIYGRTNAEREVIRNQVAYYSQDGAKYNTNALKDLNLEEPLRFIDNIDGRKGPDRMRNLILFFFSKEGYL